MTGEQHQIQNEHFALAVNVQNPQIEQRNSDDLSNFSLSEPGFEISELKMLNQIQQSDFDSEFQTFEPTMSQTSNTSQTNIQKKP